MAKRTKLEPVDRKQCQTEWTVYLPFIMGGNVHQQERCEDAPDWVATEKEKGKDGRRGAMSLCEKHRKIFDEKFPGRATFKPIPPQSPRRKVGPL